MRYLVESGALSVDSGPFTPLMAIMTRRCTLSGHSARMIMRGVMEGEGLTALRYAHACGRQNSAYSGDAVCQEKCMSLLGMAQLLIELGADALAVHSSRGCLLTIAARAGEAGLWDLLIRNAPNLAAHLAARCHAGRVLISAVDSCMRDGDHKFLGSVIAFLQSSFAERGQQRFLQLINMPLEAAADIRGHASGVHILGGRVHALCLPLLGSAGRARRNAVQLLLQAGVTPGAVKLGRQQYQLDCPCVAEGFLAMVEHAVANKDAEQNGEVLVGLLCQCCVVDGQQNPFNDGLVARGDRAACKSWDRFQAGALVATPLWQILCRDVAPAVPSRPARQPPGLCMRRRQRQRREGHGGSAAADGSAGMGAMGQRACRAPR